MNLSEDQILALAPDDASRKSGKELAAPAQWVSKGADERAAWGECQGSGSKPYQTQIDLGNLAFKCSCPSRKFPCKHGLGLLLLLARKPREFSAGNAPAWVTEWLNRRNDKEEKKAEKKDKPVDEAAQAKRQRARQQKVSDGLDELLRWVKDLIRNGILTVPEKGTGYWEGVARRMVDAQAPGLATLVRGIGEINFFAEGWQTVFLDRLLKIYLVIRGYQNVDELSGELQQDIRSLIGFAQNQEEVKALPGVRDDWFVLAKQTTEEEQLLVERNWLYGMNTHRYALILQFYVRSQAPVVSLTPGMIADATLVFYPSALPFRALVKEQHGTKGGINPEGHANWQDVLVRETQYTSAYPFGDGYPWIVSGLRPVPFNNEWWLQDRQNNMMPIVQNYGAIWKLLSLSGGALLPMSLIGRENQYEPIGVWYNNEYKIL